MPIVEDFHAIARQVRLGQLTEQEREKINLLSRELEQITAAPVPKSLGPVLEKCPPAERLLICVPSYDGKPNIELMTSFLASQGINCKFGIFGVSREVYVDRARNALVTDFLDSDATDMMFLDADLGFDPQGLARMARAERPFVAGVYPKKNEGELAFPLDFLPGTVQSDPQGLVEVAMVPTGFLRLHRSVFEAMPYTPYHDLGKFIKGYFKTQIEAGAYIGEDVAFCHLWRQLGGKIWVDPDISFKHIGWKTYEGNLKDWILSTGKGVAGNGAVPSGIPGSPGEDRPREREGRQEDWLEERRRYLGIENERGFASGEEGEPEFEEGKVAAD